jgi:polar amino acid transport system substrate-binding protein
VAFTPPYVLIEGVYAVPEDSALAAVSEVDTAGVRIGVKEGSAYDLYLSRTISRATIVRGQDGTTVFARDGLEVAAGIREPVTEFVASHPGLRLIDGAFMQIRQAVGVTRAKSPQSVAYLAAVIEDLKATGFIEDSLRRSGQRGVVPEG